MFQIGQEIEVMVTKYDTENNRISLGIKQLTDDLGIMSRKIQSREQN